MNIMNDKQRLFLSCLEKHVGRANAIHVGELLAEYNKLSLEKIKDTRTLRGIKEELNDFYGQTILSDTKGGYWIAADYDEVLAYEQFLKSYSDNMFYQVKRVKQNFTKKDGKQLSFIA